MNKTRKQQNTLGETEMNEKNKIKGSRELVIHHDRLKTAFNLEQIMELSKTTYNSITKKSIQARKISNNSFFLDNFCVEILDYLSFNTLYPDIKAAGVAQHVDNKAVIKENDFVSLMDTIGHEIGHISTHLYLNLVREEAKAYAFAYAWTKNIAARNPELMTDYEAELACPVFYSPEKIAHLMAHDAVYEIHNNPPGTPNCMKNPFDTPRHNVAREIVAAEIKKGTPAMELYQMIQEDKISMPIIAQTGAVGITRDRFYSNEKEK